MSPPLDRRAFLKTATAAACAALAAGAAAAPGTVIIDAHTHFYDPTRPQGVPWPGTNDRLLFRTVLPKDYQAQPKPEPVNGTVVVEASSWVEDNQWVLDLAAKNSFIVGLVGNLPAGTPAFAGLLKRFAANPLFRGIRINHAALKTGLDSPEFLADLRLLAKADLQLDLNGGPALLLDAAKLAGVIPDLRIVINHVANVKIDGKPADAEWRRGLEAVAKQANTFCKVSALVEGTGRNDGSAPRDVAFYRPVLDSVWESFGENRLIYGSNWPVSDRFATLATVQGIVADYFSAKGKSAAGKFFAGNAATAYKWVKR